MRTHYCRIEMVFLDIAGISNHHIAHHTQAFDIRIERADAVGQILRQHWNHTAREIHAGTAFLSIYINRVIRVDIMTDIGYRHHQTVIAADFFGKNRIVKVPRSFTVNGYQRQIS